MQKESWSGYIKSNKIDTKTKSTTVDNDKRFNISGKDNNYKYVCALQKNFKIYEVTDVRGKNRQIHNHH